MEETAMPKGWNDLSEEAKLGYVSAEFVEKVDDAMSLAQEEIRARREETKNMTDDEYSCCPFVNTCPWNVFDPP